MKLYKGNLKNKIMSFQKRNTVNKTTLTFLLVLFISIAVTAQQGINYKALIKDASGNVLNEFMNVEFTIHEATAAGTIVYQEDENYTLVDGLLIHTIGTVVSPSVGTFAAIDWAANLHFLQTTITYSGGTIDFDATEFMAVPYAKHATTAETASNVFSGDYNDLINQPTITIPTGLEALNEGNGKGWRLSGKSPSHYGNIGFNAVDLSYSITIGGVGGATGNYSIAMGTHTKASGDHSTAMGSATKALGRYSTSMGYLTNANAYASVAIGRNNVGAVIDSLSWNALDPLFEIGNGVNSVNRNNALTVLKNGNIGVGRDTPSSLLEVAHDNSPPTSSNYKNAFSIHNIVTGGSWQLSTVNSGHLSLYKNGSYRGFFNESSGAYSSISDKRLKKDIISFENGTLNKVMQLNPVSYLMKDQTGTKRNLGLISQEVQKIFPSITNYNKEADILTMSYTELIPILIKATQEQQEIIEIQNKNIEKLIQRIEALENKND